MIGLGSLLFGCASAEDAHLFHLETESLETESAILNGDVVAETTPFAKVTSTRCSGTFLNENTVLTASSCFRHGLVSRGSSTSLGRESNGYSFSSNLEQTGKDMIGMAIASDDNVYVWYDDYFASAGTSWQLSSVKTSYRYSMPPGKSPAMVVGMGIASNDRVYTWYNDGTVSIGTSRDLDYYRAPYRFTTAYGKRTSDIVGMAIASTNRVYTWYRDGTLSIGTSNDLDRYRRNVVYHLPTGKSHSMVLDMGIAKSNDKVYTWFNTNSESELRVGVPISAGGMTSYATKIERHPYRNMALVTTRHSFPRPTGVEGGSAWPILYESATSTLSGDSLTCYGYGRSSLRSSGGILRRGDNVEVRWAGGPALVVEAGADNELPWVGDLGGGCFHRTSQGNLILTSVVDDWTMHEVSDDAWLLSVSALAQWIQDRVDL